MTDALVTKRCTKCGAERPLDEFNVDRSKRDGRCSRCKDCAKDAAKTHYATNREVIRKRQSSDNGRAIQRTSRLKRQFGISSEQYDEMLSRQGGVCAICGDPPGARALAVDHDHDTNKVRELLCGRCNTALGSARDSTTILTRMIAYLTKHGGD